MTGILTLRHQSNKRLLAAMTLVATSGVVGIVATAMSRWPRCRSMATTAAFGWSTPKPAGTSSFALLFKLEPAVAIRCTPPQSKLIAACLLNEQASQMKITYTLIVAHHF